MRTIIVVPILAAAMTGPAMAADVIAGDLEISAPWARATPKGASIGGGYLKITNTGDTPDRLLGGTTAVSKSFELHSVTMDNGIMKMRPVKNGLEIKPGQTIELKPGSYHVMFVGLEHGLKQGDHFGATLQFQKAGKVEVDFAIRGIGAVHGDDMQMQHGR